ncbi:hypothetical protein PVAND_000048 [Polypedilum vanderplanki]|uniref:Cytochrome P450 n=1 Tax=Polypedilum vanderplanki TaxID=319348 RepID=A0A9J6BJ57_POLVA|nr:hypothetical protein PVAND_000048 [Polypedilum vanderplanki]
MGFVLTLIIILVISFYFWMKKHFNYWKNRGFLQVDGSFPLGSLSGVGTKICSTEKYDLIYKGFKGKASVVGFYNFLSPAVLPIEPELIKNILVLNFASFHDRGLYYNKKDDPMSANLVALEGQEWKERRTKITPLFSSGKIKMMFEIVTEIGDKLVNAIKRELNESTEQDMRVWAQKYTNDTISNIAFGLSLSCLDGENLEFLKNGKRLFELKPWEVLKILFTSEMPKLSRFLRLKFTAGNTGEFFHKTFLETFNYRQNNSIERNDLVSLLLKLKDVYTLTELAAEAFLVYTGGFETSSTLITFALYEFSLNQQIQERLRDEINSGIENNDGKLTYELLNSFKYLEMVINETLRKYPPLSNIFRKTTKDYKIPDEDLLICKGTAVIINTYSLHHDPQYFSKPDKFDPERFNEENIGSIKPYTFLPFGAGARNCIGMRFGMMQTKIAITKLISNFSFKPCSKTTIPMKFKPSSPFICPVDGMFLSVESFLLYSWLSNIFNVWKNRGFLQVKGSLPFGSLKGVGSIMTRFEGLESCYKAYKGKAPAVGYYSLFKANLLALDPNLIKNVLVTDFASFHERTLYYNKKDDPLSANTLTFDGQEWKDRRQKLTPIFTSGKMKMMFEITDKIGDQLVSTLASKLTESSDQDIRNWCQRFTADNIMNIAFGINGNCIEDPNSEFMKYGRKAVDLSALQLFNFVFTNNFPNVSRKLGLKFFPKEVGDFFLNVFQQTLEYREKNEINRNDLVSMLLKLKGQLETNEMAAESMVTFAAGYETSSTLMQFTLYELALNPEIQQRLRDEINSGIKENGGKLTYELLNSFKYLDMVIKESLRKYPSIPIYSRECNKEFQIPDTNLVIPKGTTVYISAYSLHRDPEYWINPDKFDPERFNEENERNITPFTFLPFGEGPRQCLGMRFGSMQSKAGVAKLISSFLFSPCIKTTIPMKFVPTAPFLFPKGGMWLKVEKI